VCCCCAKVAPIPEHFRTRGALGRTQAHLRRLMDRGDVPLATLHKFLWDRYRSLRQDIYVQCFEARGPGRSTPRTCGGTRPVEGGCVGSWGARILSTVELSDANQSFFVRPCVETAPSFCARTYFLYEFVYI